MAFWPFRTRPTVAPFTDPFTAPILSLSPPINADRFIYSVPDNIYLIPLSIRIQVTLQIGIHGTDPSELQFARAAAVFDHSSAAAFTAPNVISVCYAPTGAISIPAGSPWAWIQMIPPDLHLYPADTITFRFRNWAAGDTIDLAIMHAKVWEVY